MSLLTDRINSIREKINKVCKDGIEYHIDTDKLLMKIDFDSDRYYYSIKHILTDSGSEHSIGVDNGRMCCTLKLA